jgi:hypothetical protein
MGMGASLALGFIKGVNSAKAERTERDRLQQEALLENRKNLTTFVSDAVKSNMMTGEIGGAIAAGIEVGQITSMSQILPLIADLNAEADTNTITYGQMSFPVTNKKYYENISGSDLLEAGNTWLGEHERILSDEVTRLAFANYLAQDDDAREYFLQNTTRYTEHYVAGQIKANTGEDGVLRGYSDPKGQFASIYAFANQLKSPVNTMEITNTQLVDEAVANGTIGDPKTALVLSFKDTEGTTQSSVVQFSQSEYGAITQISSNLGFNSPQQLVNNFDDLLIADNVDEAYSVLRRAAFYQSQGYGALNKTAGGSDAMRVSLGMDLIEVFGDDRYRMAQAVAPIIKLEEDPSAARGPNYRYTMRPAADYLKTVLKIDVDQLNEQFTASGKALQQLNQLEDLITDNQTPTGLVAAVTKVGFGIFGQGGQIEQVFGQNAIFSENLNTEKNTTVESLGQIASKYVTSAKNLSEIDSLKISLAAQMARALDPSGRLSNQDFEVQLQRLGQIGWTTGKVQAQAGLNVVIKQFEDDRGRLVILNNVANAPSFGAREARIIRADKIVQDSLDMYRMSMFGNSSATTQTPTQPQGKVTPHPQFPNLFMDEDGTIFLDAMGAKPATPDDITNATNALFPII